MDGVGAAALKDRRTADATERRNAAPPSAGDAARPPSTFAEIKVGRSLGRYELLLPVAQGGMATVWAARMRGSRGFSKIVAVKTMLPALSKDAHFEKMFLREAELASRIKHPHVCELLDLGEEDGVLYLVMEWIDGDSLATLLNECELQGRRIPYAVIARIGLDIAKGLHAAHELKDEGGELLGLVHRDVSPQNILVSTGGVVKVVDFGIAKAVARREHQETNAGHLKGKVHFMAPEQAFCDAIDRRVDVFALGIVLYQLTTRLHPFRADNELATLARITDPSPVTPPIALSPDCPAELSAVIMKALAKDKDQRFATMDELAAALEAVLPKLAAQERARSIESFVGEVLGESASERAAAIKEARVAADARSSPPNLVGGAAGDGASASAGGGAEVDAYALDAGRAGAFASSPELSPPSWETESTDSGRVVSVAPPSRRTGPTLAALLGVFALGAAAASAVLMFRGRVVAVPELTAGAARPSSASAEAPLIDRPAPPLVAAVSASSSTLPGQPPRGEAARATGAGVLSAATTGALPVARSAASKKDASAPAARGGWKPAGAAPVGVSSKLRKPDF